MCLHSVFFVQDSPNLQPRLHMLVIGEVCTSLSHKFVHAVLWVHHVSSLQYFLKRDSSLAPHHSASMELNARSKFDFKPETREAQVPSCE